MSLLLVIDFFIAEGTPEGGDRKLRKRGAPEGVRGRRQGEKTVYFIFYILVLKIADRIGEKFPEN